MARRGKTLTKAEKERRREQREEKELANVVTDMTARFTCLVELARDFGGQCEAHLQDLDFDLASMRLAAEFWADRPGPPQQAVDLLAALATEHQRHRDAIADLAGRFTAFIDSQADLEHVHLRPTEPYRVLLRQRLFPDS